MKSAARPNQKGVLYAGLPLGLLLLAMNIAVAAALFSAQHSRVVLASSDIRHALQRDIEVIVTRLRTVGGMPSVNSVLVQASRDGALAGNSMDDITDRWPSLGRDEMAVREVLDNNVADVLRCPGVNPEGQDLILLTDARGRVLAASEKPPLYRYAEEAWWKQARTAERGAVTSEGLTAGGRLALTLPLKAKAGTRGGEGILRAEVSLAQLGGGLLRAGETNSVAVAIIGRTPVLVAGSSAVFARAFPWLGDFGGGRVRRAWRAGLRVASWPLEAGVAWTEPLNVAVLRREPALPAGVILPVAGSLAVSALLIMCWALMFRVHLSRSYAVPSQELIEAGNWILHTALGRASIMGESPKVSKDGKPYTPEASPLQRELQQWLYRLLQDLHEEYTSRAFEMERDLNLARDFQLAYMQRAYPKIPAVHVEGRLRLDFYHRYEPALALGGDFYNILTLAPDCGGVFVADVMGHGTRSALITAIIRTLIDDLALQGRNARHFLTEMNKQFCGLLKSVPHPLFASAFYFVADTTARVATYSSAGHPAPFQVRRSVGRITRMEVPMPRGAALGMIPNETYTGGYSRLIDGDLFVFFTDGVYEAHNVQGEEFGMARMEQVIRSLMYKSSKEIVDGLMDAITNFVSYEPIADDICIVAVEVTTKTAAA